MTLAEPLDKVINFLLMNPVVLLPAFPRVMRMLKVMSELSREWQSLNELTKRPNA
jgi:hypothetical protein